MSARQATTALIVDDEPLIRWAVAETLKDCGCDVVEAASAQAALDALGASVRPFDVVILDYHLPDAHDLTLLATTRRLAPGSHVIMLTAFMDPDVAAEARALGVRHVLPKPIELDALAALVANGHRRHPTGP